MSADGKIADYQRSPARFGSSHDRAHLEACVAEADGFLFGAGTLRAYGTSLLIRDPHCLAQRQERGQSPQPIHIVCSPSGQLNPSDRFFQQPIQRWLLTTASGAAPWGDRSLLNPPLFHQLLVVAEDKLASPQASPSLDLRQALTTMAKMGIQRLAVGGGGRLVADLLAAQLVDELWLTVCPLLLGGTAAPTPVDGPGYLQTQAPHLELLSVQAIASEVFLHYRILPKPMD